jgi:HK97 family phage prohead protease
MEYKAIPSFAKVEEDRTVSGFASVFGNVDSYGDRVMPGAFKKSINEGMRRVKHLWSHNPFEPPTAAIKEIREAGRRELPDEILDLYPDAKGGLLVTRVYLDTPRGNEILEGIKTGAISEMSFGFDVMKWENEEVRDGELKGMNVRNLKELRLWDTSDVTWGANSATVAVKMGIPPQLMELAALSREWVSDPDALTTGSLFSAAKMERLQKAIGELNELLTAAEPPAEDPAIAETKARALTEQIRIKLAIADAEYQSYLVR